MEDYCAHKESLEELMKKIPLIEGHVESSLDDTVELNKNYVACYICDGYNYNCPDYKIAEVKK